MLPAKNIVLRDYLFSGVESARKGRPISLRLRLSALGLIAGFVLAACGSGTVSPSPIDTPTSVLPTASPTPGPSFEVSPGDPSPSAAVDPTSTPGAFNDGLLAIELRDVRNGETFTLGELAADAPVIVETMAIWCSNCRQQMHEVIDAHALADFHSVSIDVEPAEVAEDLVAYAAREGFDWPFVLADAQLATTLRERFGAEVLFPPGMPKLLIRADGSVELLPLGELLSADTIAALVAS